MAEAFSLRDHLFNAETVGRLAAEHAAALPHFDAARFTDEALAGLDDLGLMQRLDFLASCLERQLATDFPTMADQLEAAMPPPLDPDLKDDDFGQFIHALPGVLAVRHGLEAHRDRALDLLHAATQRFSMEFYIRPFLTRWPEATLARLALWAGDDNYHVRRLVSEGTRPRLPWAQAVSMPLEDVLPLLDRLHADPTRYVTRSVANHLNDIAKTRPEVVIDRLRDWRAEGRQAARELDWMTRHALRVLIKQGHPRALELLGYRCDLPVKASLSLENDAPRIGEVLALACKITGPAGAPVMVDYRLRFARPGGKSAEKVFKLKAAKIPEGGVLQLAKRHRLKGDATTFTLHTGAHAVVLQVNGCDRAEVSFDLRPAS